MRKFLSTLLMLLAATWLAGCGESGGFTNTVSISVSITPEQTTVPANILNVEPALGSPYTVHVPVRVMRENDTPVADGTNVNMTVSGVQHGLLSVATETPEDFVNTYETINQETTGGIAHFYFTSTSIPGQATLTASVADPASGQTIAKSTTITVGAGASSGKAAELILFADEELLAQGLGASTTARLQALIRDEVANPVPDANPSVNNLRARIITGSAGGARLLATSANGTQQSAIVNQWVYFRSVSGVGELTLVSGPILGPVLIEVETDRQDNNVDNGVTDRIYNYRIIYVTDEISADAPETEESISGVGDNVVAFSVQSSPVTFEFTHTGGGVFFVDLLDANAVEIKSLVIASGAYSGATIESLVPGDYYLRIQAGGSWTVKIIQPGGGGGDGGGTTPLSIATSSLPNGNAGEFYVALLEGTGGKLPYTWTVDVGTLPDGLTLDADGIISGTPTVAGTFNFILKLTDDNGTSVMDTFSITIGQTGGGGTTPAITTTSLPGGTVGTGYVALLEGSGGTQPYTWSIESGSLPGGLALAADTGIISGTPTTAGLFNFIVQLTDAGGLTALQALSITIAASSGTPVVEIGSVVLLASSPQLPSAGTPVVTLTAFVRNTSNVLVEGVTVNFSADNDGLLQIINGVTDASGTAQATLSTVTNKANRTINVTATAGAESDSVAIEVIGTTINISGASSTTIDTPVNLTFTLRDSAGNAIANQSLTLSTTGGTLGTTNLVTNASGQASTTLTSGAGGSFTVTATGLGATANHAVNVSSDEFVFVTPLPPPDPRPEIELGTLTDVTVRLESGGAAVPDGTTINFSATRGTLSATSAVTTGGNATVQIESSDAGPSIITAIADEGTPDEIVIQLEVLFYATVADSMTLQASPAVIGTNPGGGTGEQSTISAVVRDPNGNLVKNKTINFTLNDVTGGTIFPSSAITDQYGRAETIYTAGPVASALDGVSVTATVADTPAVNDAVTLTVAQKSLFITLGTSNLIQKPDSLRYEKPYGVLVTDAGGAPVANANITLTIWPTDYYKGYYEKPATSWVRTETAGPCGNEDDNKNGVLDAGEDFNSNLILDPGNVVTLSSANLVTDETGFADFEVVYFQEYATWIDVELTATATVSGSESTEIVTFNLPVLAADVADAQPSVPNSPSPFGQSNSCADDL